MLSCISHVYYHISGYFCDNSLVAVGDLTNNSCPAGFYCPQQTNRSNEYPCPAGTYNNQTGLSLVGECQACPPGYYCQNTGLPEPQGLCFPG